MIRAVIVDDEPYASETLEIYLKRFSDKVEVVGKATNAKQGFEIITTIQPDVVFLDIEMPGGNGFDMLGMFDEIPFQIVFTTAYDHYAIKAIKYSALDYIMKPVHVKELEEAIEKSINKLNVDRQLNVTTLLEGVRSMDKLGHIVLPSQRNEYELIALKDIVLLKADGAYTNFVLNNGKTIMTSKNLKEYEDLFKDTQLVRVHKSYIVNLNYIEKYLKKEGGKILLKNGEVISISRSRKEVFLRLLNK